MKRGVLLALILAACGKRATRPPAKDAGVVAPPGPAPTWRWELEHLDLDAIATMPDGGVVVAGLHTLSVTVAGKKIAWVEDPELLVVLLDPRGVPAAAHVLPSSGLIDLSIHGDHIYVAATDAATDAATIYDVDPTSGLRGRLAVPAEAGLVLGPLDWELTALPDGDLLLVGAGDAIDDSSVITRLGPDGKVRWPPHGTGHDYVTGVEPHGDEILVSARDTSKDETKRWTGIGVLGADGQIARRCGYPDLYRQSPQAIVVDGDAIFAVGNGGFQSGPRGELIYAMACDGTGRRGDIVDASGRSGRLAGAGLVGHSVVAVYQLDALDGDPASRGGTYVVRDPQSASPRVIPLELPAPVSYAYVLADGGVIVKGTCGDDIACVERYDLGL